MPKCRVKNFGAISEDFRRRPKTTEDLRRFPKISKIFKNFGNLLECWFLQSPVLFPEFSKEFPSIQQRIYEPLLPVTGRPLIFFM